MVWKEFPDPICSQNLRRLFDQNPDLAIENDEFVKMAKRAEADGDTELSRKLQMVSCSFTNGLFSTNVLLTIDRELAQ